MPQAPPPLYHIGVPAVHGPDGMGRLCRVLRRGRGLVAAEEVGAEAGGLRVGGACYRVLGRLAVARVALVPIAAEEVGAEAGNLRVGGARDCVLGRLAVARVALVPAARLNDCAEVGGLRTKRLVLGRVRVGGDGTLSEEVQAARVRVGGARDRVLGRLAVARVALVPAARLNDCAEAGGLRTKRLVLGRVRVGGDVTLSEEVQAARLRAGTASREPHEDRAGGDENARAVRQIGLS
jgi:hypothetical protein